MINKNNNKKIKFLENEKIKLNKINYGFFTRLGGFSKKNFNSLNCSKKSGDSNRKVQKNIQIAKKAIGLENTNLKFIKQIHSNKVKFISKKSLKETIIADGSITNEKKISLAILTADCAPIFLIDEKNDIICAIHCGWKGCLNNIVSKAVAKIKTINKNEKIIALIGPCLEYKNFEVDLNFKRFFLKKNYQYTKFFKKKRGNKKYHFNMRGLINYQLRKAEISKKFNINICTYLNNNLFFSHRRSFHENSLPTGRMINIIGFKS